MLYFERFVSRRYLFSRTNRALVSVITFISVAGVTVGVAALIIVLGVIEGIDRDIFGKITDFYPHLKITNSANKTLKNPEAILDAVLRRPEVATAEPVITKQVLFTHGSEKSEVRVPGQIIGVDVLGTERLYKIPDKKTGGDILLEPGVVMLGAPLGFHLNARLGDEVLAITGSLARTANGWHPRIRPLQTLGVFQTGLWDFDLITGFVSTDTARDLFGMEEGVDYLHVKMKNPFQAAALKTSLQAELGPAYQIKTWEEENGAFFQALKLEKLGLIVVLLLVVIVASFNIAGTLILLVIEKKGEIGILKAIGSSDGMIRRTYIAAGSTIGVLGTVLGVGLGYLGAHVIKGYNLFGMPPSAYGFDRLPVVINPTTVALIVASSLAICLVAAMFPAAQAAKLDPIEALRHD